MVMAWGVPVLGLPMWKGTPARAERSASPVASTYTLARTRKSPALPQSCTEAMSLDSTCTSASIVW